MTDEQIREWALNTVVKIMKARCPSADTLESAARELLAMQKYESIRAKSSGIRGTNPTELIVDEIENRSFQHYCTCGGFAWDRNGRPQSQPHMTWCPQYEEYATWWAIQCAAAIRKGAEPHCSAHTSFDPDCQDCGWKHDEWSGADAAIRKGKPDRKEQDI